MAKLEINDLVRLVERESISPEEPTDSLESNRGGEISTDWEMLCHLKELWNVCNPTLRGNRESHRRLLGLPIKIAKAAFRFLGQPFINEILDRQTTFNHNAVSLLQKMRDIFRNHEDRIDREHHEHEARFSAMENTIRGWNDELEQLKAKHREQMAEQRRAHSESIRSLESGLKNEISGVREIEQAYWELMKELSEAAHAEPGEKWNSVRETGTRLFSDRVIDRVYGGFHEDVSDADLTRQLYRPYVEYFKRKGPVVDLGCGRGIFLKLLKEEGIECYGVERNSDMAESCVAAGLDVRCDDILKHLETLDGNSLGGVFLGHVVEHLRLTCFLRLLQLCEDCLKPGGELLFESPNTTNLLVLGTSYYRDPTHQPPRHPETYQFLVESSGFRDVELHFGFPAPDEHKLKMIQGDTPMPPDAINRMNRNMEKLNELFYGQMNFTVRGRKGGGES